MWECRCAGSYVIWINICFIQNGVKQAREFYQICRRTCHQEGKNQKRDWNWAVRISLSSVHIVLIYCVKEMSCQRENHRSYARFLWGRRSTAEGGGHVTDVLSRLQTAGKHHYTARGQLNKSFKTSRSSDVSERLYQVKFTFASKFRPTNLRNSCYHSVQNLLPNRLLSWHVKVKIHQTWFYPLFCMFLELGLWR